MRSGSKRCNFATYSHWRVHRPYFYVIDEVAKKAYAYNRDYAPLGIHDCSSVAPGPRGFKPVGTSIYLYRDGCKPWESRHNEELYEANLADLKSKYELIDNWEADITETPSASKGQMCRCSYRYHSRVVRT